MAHRTAGLPSLPMTPDPSPPGAKTIALPCFRIWMLMYAVLCAAILLWEYVAITSSFRSVPGRRAPGTPAASPRVSKAVPQLPSAP